MKTLLEGRFSGLLADPKRLGLGVTLAAALTYSIIFSIVSILKFSTFHASWFDLGLNNQVFWSILHGGYAGYHSTGWDQLNSFPWTRLSFLVLLPLYAAYPNPAGLLVIQSFLIGFAAIPLYLIAYRILRRATAGLLLVATYLISFEMQEVNLFDFHTSTLFPLIFFLLVLAWLTNHRVALVLVAAIGSLINPLASLTLVALLSYLFIQEYLENRPTVATRQTLYRRLLSQTRKTLASGWSLVAAFLLVLVLNLVTLYLSFHGSGAGANTSLGGLDLSLSSASANLDSKLLYFFYMLAPFGFLAVCEPLFLIVAAPYAFYIFFLASPYPIPIFGGEYPDMLIPVIVVGTILGISRLASLSSPSSPVRIGHQMNETDVLRRRFHRETVDRFALVAVALGLGFALIFSPLSPYNSSVAGGIFQGNENLPSITSDSPSAQFLRQALGLVPANAGVLTQNDIPQLSGRENVQVAGFPIRGVSYDYIVADSEIDYFSSFSQILPSITAALTNGTFGILAEGYGVYVLERGYAGRAELFAPSSYLYSGSQLDPYAPSVVVGTEIIHNASSTSTQYVWYGPYATLPPGDYSATFTLRASGNFTATETVIELDVYEAEASLAASSISGPAFEGTLGNHNFTLDFSLTNVSSALEYRGLNLAAGVTIELIGVSIVELGA